MNGVVRCRRCDKESFGSRDEAVARSRELSLNGTVEPDVMGLLLPLAPYQCWRGGPWHLHTYTTDASFAKRQADGTARKRQVRPRGKGRRHG